ncbi:hypothetical protein H2198_006045 [Neophaeococcomyces mojaviensis]|uniref:Uncharacterized protein n=1 Tax=Neophaeococcomyces mojaviensis TaxID=3383035 RepID=A0ACC3A495_9EURO|nr:hypothetical protein H2198_006045 [Knufia sp. JES_112]
MYDRRLKDWRISKNLKAADKDKIINVILGSGTWASDSASTAEHHVSITAKDRRKAMRHYRVNLRGNPAEPVSKSGKSHFGACSPSPPITSYGSSASSPIEPELWTIVTRSDDALTTKTEFGSATPATQASLLENEHGVVATPQNTGRGSPWNQLQFYDREMDEVALPKRPPTTASDDSTGVLTSPSSDIILLPAPSIPHNKTLNVEKMLLSVNAYFHGCATAFRYTNQFDIIPSGGETMAPSYPFWSELKHGIYLLKVQSPELAWPALDRACALAPTIINETVSFDFLFLKELFLTLSPVNVRVYPLIRIKLLQYLSTLAHMKLNKNHPLSIICHELQQDENSHAVSGVALECMLNTIKSHGSGISHGRGENLYDLAFRLECAAITLLRRDGQLDLASYRAKSLLNRAKAMLTTLESRYQDISSLRQARMAATELAHVCMDQRGDHYDEAIEHCLFALTGVQYDSGVFEGWPPSSLTFDRQAVIRDKRSVYTFEDLAKIYDELGDRVQAIAWLEMGVLLAHEVFDAAAEVTATTHIVEKLNRLRAEMIGSG